MTNVDERLAALSARFVEQAGATIGAIEQALARQAWADLAGHCHSLAGRAGMFGHPAIGERARAVELAVDEQRSHGEIASLTGDLLAQLEALSQAQNG